MLNFGDLLANFATYDLKCKKWLIGPTSPCEILVFQTSLVL